jgi:hypothetical protein
MADNVAITAGSGTTLAADDIGGVLTPRVKVQWGPDGTVNDADIASGKPLPVQLRTATGTATPLPALGTAGTAASDVITIQGIASGTVVPISSTALGTTAITRAAGAADAGTVRVTVDSGQVSALATAFDALNAGSPAGGTKVYLPSDQPFPKGLSNRVFGVAFATLTRPANTTAYAAADSISDNATAGSVTALVSGNISDTNDDPIFISSIHVASTDTGLAGKKLRAYIFNTDPTASSGVGGGDNAAYSQKMAGYLGSFMGWMETGFSDGSVGRLVPCYNETNFTQAGGFIVVPPKSGAKTLYIQYQAVESFTPSANSTTIIGTARGWQGRAA